MNAQRDPAANPASELPNAENSSQLSPAGAGELEPQLQALDLFLNTFSNEASRADRRELFYPTLVQKLPPLIGAESSSVWAEANGQMHLLFQGPATTIGQAIDRDAARGAIATAVAGIEGGDNGEITAGGRQWFVAKIPRESADSDSVQWMAIAFCFNTGSDASSLSTADRSLYAELVGELASLCRQFEDRLSVLRNEARLKQLQQLAVFLRNLSAAGSYREMAYSLVNDLAHFSQADRVSYFELNGQWVACSGIAEASRKSRIIRRLGNLARLIGRRGKDVSFYPGGGPTGSDPVDRRIDDWLMEQESTALLARVIRHDRRRLGVLTLEYMGQQATDWLDKIQRIDTVLQTATPIFAKSRQLHSIPLLGTASWVFDTVLARPLRTSFLVLLVGALLVAGALLAATTQGNLEITARGSLVPVRTRQVFATATGQIRQVLVDEGDYVVELQEVVELESIELEGQIKKVEGELEELRQQLEVLRLAEMSNIRPETSEQLQSLEIQQAQLAAEVKRVEIRCGTLEQTLEQLEKQSARLLIRSPLAGEVTSRKTITNLVDRPVERGDPLLTIADLDDEWEIQLDVPESKIRYVVQALETLGSGEPSEVGVRLKLSSNPTLDLTGRVREVDFVSRAQLESGAAESARIRVLVDIDEAEFEGLLRMGTGVDARIDCGQRSYLFLWTYEIRDKVQELFFF